MFKHQDQKREQLFSFHTQIRIAISMGYEHEEFDSLSLIKNPFFMTSTHPMVT